MQRGTGIGLPRSSDPSTAAFHNLGEESWAGIDAVREFFGVQAYWRFMDDALLVGTKSRRADVRVFVTELMKKVEPFCVEAETVSFDDPITFLDLVLAKTDDGRIVTMPCIKSSDVSIPLSSTSDHPRHVLEGWPRSVATNVAALSSDGHLARAALDQFIGRHEA